MGKKTTGKERIQSASAHRPFTAGPRFGAHMSVAGGLHQALQIAADAGCDCLQVFVKNQRQWKAPPISDDAVATWNDARARTKIEPVVAHASYLINLATGDDTIWRKSLDAYIDELLRCERLGIIAAVVHPGAHLGKGESSGCRRVAEALREILDRIGDARVRPTLEVTAGQGSCIGHRFEHLGEIISLAGDDSRLAICFDTCHALAAGYRFDDDTSYSETFAAFDRTVGLNRLACFHLNDSLKPLGSRVDRHTHIGDGHVGMEAFRRIVNDPRFVTLPMILETPKEEDESGREMDLVNLDRLRRLRQTSNAAANR